MTLLQQGMPITLHQTTIPIRCHHQEAVSWCRAECDLTFSFESMPQSIWHSNNLQSTNSVGLYSLPLPKSVLTTLGLFWILAWCVQMKQNDLLSK